MRKSTPVFISEFLCLTILITSSTMISRIIAANENAKPVQKGKEAMNDSVLTSAKTMCFVASSKFAEAKTFYSETLGLQFLADDEYGLMFSVNQTQILRLQKVKDLKPQQFTVFGWQIEDIEKAVAELSARGVKFEKFGFPSQDELGVCSFPNGDKVAWFKDPDGNTLSIAQIAGK